MELRHLNEFVHLVSSGNFTETARELHLTQPSLSKHIKVLEHELGVELFNRAHNSVELTEEGFYFFGVAKNIISMLASAQRALIDIRLHKPIIIDGRFDDPLISSLISSTLGTLKKTEEYLPIMFNHDVSKSPLSLLQQGRIDLIIDILTLDDEETSYFDQLPLLIRPFMAIMERNHPLAGKEALTIMDLQGTTLLHLIWENEDTAWKRIKKLCLDQGFSLKHELLPVRSLTEGFTNIPSGAVLILPNALDDLKFVKHSPHYCVLPFIDPEAAWIVNAIYRHDNFEKLASLLQALQETALLIMRQLKPENMQSEKESTDRPVQ